MTRTKSSFILSALGLALSSASVSAHVPTEHHSILSIPEQQEFEFSVTALALKPGATNLNYVIYNKELPALSPTWLEKELKPHFGAAFELGGDYNFAEGKGLNLSWTHLNTTTHRSTLAPDPSYFLGPDYEIGPPGLSFRGAMGSARFKYDVINLDVGQTLAILRHLEMRMFGGVSNTYLHERVRATYIGTNTSAPTGPFSAEQSMTSRFNGLGPRFGVTSSYKLNNGFGFLGEAAASLIIGESHTKTLYEIITEPAATTFVNDQFIKDQDLTQVIPGFDGKLGVSYTHSFNHCSVLMVKGGYQAAVYVNAIHQYLPGTLVPNTSLQLGGLFVDTMNHTLSNYSVQGPFLGVTWEM